jgi:hypothetical protein
LTSIGFFLAVALKQSPTFFIRLTPGGALHLNSIALLARAVRRIAALRDNALNWADVLPRDQGRVQLSITGKGGKVRQVLLPEIVSRSLLSLRGEPPPMIPCS